MIDYEKSSTKRGSAFFFGRQAGEAGMVETLWSLGQRLNVEGMRNNPFSTLRQTYAYPSLAAAKEDIQKVGSQIQEKGLDPSLVPLVCGFTGYGHVSQGAQEIFELLPFEEILPAAIEVLQAKNFSANKLYKVVFRRRHGRAKAKGPRSTFKIIMTIRKYKPVFDAHVPI
jgi:alpha-aminoadipic semialdehyde synthase